MAHGQKQHKTGILDRYMPRHEVEQLNITLLGSRDDYRVADSVVDKPATAAVVIKETDVTPYYSRLMQFFGNLKSTGLGDKDRHYLAVSAVQEMCYLDTVYDL